MSLKLWQDLRAQVGEVERHIATAQKLAERNAVGADPRQELELARQTAENLERNLRAAVTIASSLSERT